MTSVDPGLAGTAEGLAILAIEDARAPTPAAVSLLVQGLASPNPHVKSAATFALGRLERRDVVPHLLPLLKGGLRTDAAFAIAQAMQGDRMPLDVEGTQVDGVLAALLAAAGAEVLATPLGEMSRALGRLPYERPEQVARADAFLVQVLSLSRHLRLIRKKQGDARAAVHGAYKGAELLGRLHTKLATPSEELVDLLRRHVTGNITEVPITERGPTAHALLALIAVRGLDEEALRVSLTSRARDVRRIAVTALSGGASPMTGVERADFLRAALADGDFQVRLEAVRGYARHLAKSDGCKPLIDAVSDDNTHVALAAIDALGTSCAGDENARDRLIGEARTPPNVGSWHREAHAMVSLARLSPSHSEAPLLSHSRHLVWQVRMYAARAAAVLNDVSTLERLALDDHDNVRDATLAPLRRLKGDEAEPQFVAALARNDYQLLRTAAREMAGMTPTKALTAALLDALKRVTLEKKDTSRDPRIAILQRLGEIGNSDIAEQLMPFLRDFDTKVADEAAATLAALTGRSYSPDPQLLPRPQPPTGEEILYLKQYRPVLMMASGKVIRLTLHVDATPLNAVRFLRLARAQYFNNLTFHRIAPNFVVQGGSPGANEYVGDGPYVRDEINRRSHLTGTIGLSTRGRDTGDAQFFFNLVDNLRLDFDYTVFGQVASEDMDRVLELLEGDTIKEISWTSSDR